MKKDLKPCVVKETLRYILNSACTAVQTDEASPISLFRHFKRLYLFILNMCKLKTLLRLPEFSARPESFLFLML